VSRFIRRPDPPAGTEDIGRPGTSGAGGGGSGGGAPTIVAELGDGPLAGRSVHVEAVEGRPPKTVDLDAPDGGTCRYCLEQWTQAGGSAAYTFLYRV
jgi:hypothetical protein